MLPLLVALDLDGTLKPPDGPIDSVAVSRIRALKSRGIIFVLVSGRCLADIKTLVDPQLFDAIVAENGSIALIGRTKRVLAPPWWLEKLRELPAEARGGCEEVIVSMSAERYSEALNLAKRVGGSVERNKDRVMILPPNIDKASGLSYILETLGVEPRLALCVGDGENDIPLFRLCGLRVALKNSVAQLKEMADYVSSKEDGEGVSEALSLIFESSHQHT